MQLKYSVLQYRLLLQFKTQHRSLAAVHFCSCNSSKSFDGGQIRGVFWGWGDGAMPLWADPDLWRQFL